MKRDYCIKISCIIIILSISLLIIAGTLDIERDTTNIPVTIIEAEDLETAGTSEEQPDTIYVVQVTPKSDASIISTVVSASDEKGFRFSKLFLSIITFIMSWLLIKYITLFLNILSERWYKYRISIKGLIPIFRTTGWTIAISFILIGIVKPPIQSVLAITASAGIAIGFASQDILKNIFGGVIILMDKPFMVGDKIKIDNHYGEVISIGLRTVRVVTPDDSIVSIPNSEMVSKSVSNANSGASDCQVVAEFFFEPDLNLDKAHDLALKCASLSTYVYLNKPVAAIFMNEMFMGKSMIKMRLKAYVFDHRYEFAFITDMSKIVMKEFTKAGLINTPLKTAD